MLRKSLSSFLFCILFINCLGAIVDKGGSFNMVSLNPSATIIRSENYKELGEAEGESSTFYLLGLFPVTNSLNLDYALSQAAQKYPDGGSIVNLRIWLETHYYFPVGKVLVLKVKGNVIDIRETQPLLEPTKGKQGLLENQTKDKKGGIKVGGN
jgi:hypothetical protein